MAATSQKRCEWTKDDPLYIHHHHTEWGVPVSDSRALWEHLVLDRFQPGLSWRTVLNKRDNFRAAFAGFQPEKVVRFTDKDVARLLSDAGIIRSKVKINTAIHNARAFLQMRKAGYEFSDWVWNFANAAQFKTDGKAKKMSRSRRRLPLTS
jgi:DNA-3-methyladenine glycosylase I